MMKNNLVLSPGAKADLAEIKNYIAFELKNPKAADSVIRRIGKTIDILETYAFAGAPLISITELGGDIRFLVSGNYLVFYRIDGHNVYVVRVMNGRQNYIEKLFHGEIDESPEE